MGNLQVRTRGSKTKLKPKPPPTTEANALTEHKRGFARAIVAARHKPVPHAQLGGEPDLAVMTGKRGEVQPFMEQFGVDTNFILIEAPPDLEEIEINLGQHIVSLIKLARFSRKPADEIQQLVELIVAKPNLAKPENVRLALMAAKARNEVFADDQWLTAKQVAELAGLSSTNPSAQPNKWKRDGLIFAIDRNGTDYFQMFGLDPKRQYRPFAQLKDVIAVLRQELNDWDMALWFTADNRYLYGKRHADVVAQSPAEVLKAATLEVAGIQHG